MSLDNISNFLIESKSRLFSAIEKINTNGSGFLVVTKKGKLFGTLTDSDLRRKILDKKIDKNSFVWEICNKKPKYLFIKKKNLEYFADIIFRNNKKIDFIPIVKKNKLVCNIIKRKDLYDSDLLYDFCTLILAGGKGKRLLPITKNLPKPLIEFEGYPYLIQLLNKIKSYKSKKIYLSIFYQKEKIKKQIAENIKKEELNNIKFLEEKKSLGTAGSLFMIKKKISKYIIVLNSDIIFNINLNYLINFHEINKNFLTIAAKDQQVTVPYGVLNFNNNNNFEKIIEKPSINFLINSGIYIFNSEIINFIKKPKKIDMPELINQLRSKKKKIGFFPINEKYIDYGSHQNLYEAKKNFKDYFYYLEAKK